MRQALNYPELNYYVKKTGTGFVSVAEKHIFNGSEMILCTLLEHQG